MDILPWGILEWVSLGPVPDERDRILSDEGDDLHVIGRLLGQQVGLVFVRGPKNLRHEDPDGFHGNGKLLSDLRVERVHEPERASHLVGRDDELVVQVGLLIEEAHDGDLSALHVARHA